MLVGYARVSTDRQDVESQRAALLALGVTTERIYSDEGFTGKNTSRPALQLAMAAVRDGDELVVTKLDRLARSVPDLRAILGGLYSRGVRVRIGNTVYDPSDPMGRLLVNVLAMVAEFEADLISARTKAGMEVARSKGKLKGKAPKLNTRQARHLVELYEAKSHTVGELAQRFGISHATVYRTVQRRAEQSPQAESPELPS